MALPKMEGLVEEAAEMAAQEGSERVRDAGVISAAQRVEHYEIAAYGCAITHARLLGLEDILAEQEVNGSALHATQ